MRRPFLGAPPPVAPCLHNVQAMWTARTVGDAVKCAACGRPRVALSIEGPRSYQWHCMHCGARSPLFFVRQDIARVHISRVEDQTPSGSPKETP